MIEIGHHNPVIAYGKSVSKTASVSVGEAVSSFTISNTPNPISVDDQVFISASDDSKIQSLGLCLTSDATTITTTLQTQQSIGSSAKLWVPTDYVSFPWRFSRDGGNSQSSDDGFQTLVTAGAQAFVFQNADASDSLNFSVSACRPEEYEAWKTFRRTRIGLTMSLAWWDEFTRTARCAEVQRLDGAVTSTITQDDVLASFSMAFFIVADDTYVT